MDNLVVTDSLTLPMLNLQNGFIHLIGLFAFGLSFYSGLGQRI